MFWVMTAFSFPCASSSASFRWAALGLIDYFKGDKLVVINKAPTPRDSYADLLIQAPIGEVFSQL